MPDRAEWPRISIVTPSFNQAEFLEETIRSVLLQGYPNLEYFVIDGGSKDASPEIIKKYEPWLAGWTSERDRGQSHAINKGFARCTGDLLTFQNSDDFYLPGAFLSAARLWTNHKDCGAIVGAFRRCNTESQLVTDPVPAVLKSSSPLDLTLGPPGVYRLHQVSTFFSRQTLDVVGRNVVEDMHYVMDRELIYRVCRRAEIVISPDCYAAFRWHENSKSIAFDLPFAREFAQLYLRSLNGKPAEDQLRKRMARHRITSGYLKAAKRTPRSLAAAAYLVKAVFSDASLLTKRQYAAAWFNALKFQSMLFAAHLS
jgi:glycosyltransferase involved in cell wall biosynthesis